MATKQEANHITKWHNDQEPTLQNIDRVGSYKRYKISTEIL